MKGRPKYQQKKIDSEKIGERNRGKTSRARKSPKTEKEKNRIDVKYPRQRKAKRKQISQYAKKREENEGRSFLFLPFFSRLFSLQLYQTRKTGFTSKKMKRLAIPSKINSSYRASYSPGNTVDSLERDCNALPAKNDATSG